MQLSPDSLGSIHLAASTNEGASSHARKMASIDLPVEPEHALPQQEDLEKLVRGRKRLTDSVFWQKWYTAFRNILPVYIAIHLALLAISCLAFLFLNPDFSSTIMPVATLWEQWRHWDTNFYVAIVTQGYTTRQEMAFFPLYPLLTRGVMSIASSPIIAGMIVSNVAELVMFIVLYRLVDEDFGGDRAYHTVLYFAIFPSAFFFSGVYTESLFLCLSTLTFYQIRRGRWWLAGLFACFAGLTRPDGMYLVIPFCYEYLSRIWQRHSLTVRALFSVGQIAKLLKGIRFNILFGLCFFGGIALFIAYGRDHFQDPLAFVHAHAYWNRSLHFPGWGMLVSLWAILHHGLLSFTTMRNVIDLGADTFVLILIVLSFVGPWKFPQRLWSYGFYALVLFIYFQLVPVGGNFPLESMPRFLLEIFPAFIVLAGLSKYRTINLSYCMLAGALFFFLLVQFLTGHWIT